MHTCALSRCSSSGTMAPPSKNCRGAAPGLCRSSCESAPSTSSPPDPLSTSLLAAASALRFFCLPGVLPAATRISASSAASTRHPTVFLLTASSLHQPIHMGSPSSCPSLPCLPASASSKSSSSRICTLGAAHSRMAVSRAASTASLGQALVSRARLMRLAAALILRSATLILAWVIASRRVLGSRALTGLPLPRFSRAPAAAACRRAAAAWYRAAAAAAAAAVGAAVGAAAAAGEKLTGAATTAGGGAAGMLGGMAGGSTRCGG
mmetsp:Transcript_11568/g.24809  ORF Transcript_11568/g.24809 Transcript_11568/m.24809 type:complete len:265 (-) Transcript_11568:166-960(-)